MPNILYNKRTLLGAVRQMESPRTFLRDTFFTNIRTFQTETVEIDIVKGDRQVAPFVHPIIGGKVMVNKGYQTNSYKPPLVAPEKIITAKDLNDRLAGENPYETTSAEDRNAKKTAEYLELLEDSITRREELMCSQAIFEGKVVVKGEGLDEEINFGFTNNATIATKWSIDGSNPIADLEAMYSLVQTNGMTNPGICIMANNVANAFINHKLVKEVLDIKNYQLAKIEPKTLPNGTRYIGRLSLLDLDIYTYSGMYTDDWTGASPVTKKFVPDNKVALLPIDANFSLAYGAVEIADDKTEQIYLAEGRRIPDIYVERKPVRKILNLSSRPLPILDKVDSFAVADAL
ncbi:hypothetical protein J2Z76_002723 [Sedimentibacter acidaminivorans]|uniref:Phage major capsid protein E n=1 Tax=Sedimentibacter acidaminivorans TaxID=913099 RepID=A0ABS4GGN3_9FIRM|nr:major capsid protein [Sedimentibacter acidaminivorans]MBP1926853.1 hypothetical protein [Sedimentibacter acidaminivorans]